MEVRLSQGLVTEDQDHTRLPLIRSILLGVRQVLKLFYSIFEERYSIGVYERTFKWSQQKRIDQANTQTLFQQLDSTTILTETLPNDLLSPAEC